MTLARVIYLPMTVVRVWMPPITRGANAGKLRVKISDFYSSKVLEVRRLITEQGYGVLCDYRNVFRDE